jgi:hypothetical protein
MPKTYDPLLMLVALVAVVSIGIMLFPAMDANDLVGNAFDKLKQKSVTRLSDDSVEGYMAVFKTGETTSIAVLNPDVVHDNAKLNGRLSYALRTARLEQIEPVHIREETSLIDMDVELVFYDKYESTYTASTQEEEMEIIANSILYGMQDEYAIYTNPGSWKLEFYDPPYEYIREESKDYSVLAFDPNLYEWYSGETSIDFYDSTNEPKLIWVLAVDGDGNAYKIVNEALLDAIRETVEIGLGKPGTGGELVDLGDETDQRTLPEDDPIDGIPVDLDPVEIGEEDEDPEQTPLEIDPVDLGEEESEEPESIEIGEDDYPEEGVEEIPVECSEDDAGDDPSVKGYHTGTYPWGGETYMIPDSCRISTTNEKVTSCTSEDCKLMEYYCVEDSADSKFGYLFWNFYEGVDCNNGATIYT